MVVAALCDSVLQDEMHAYLVIRSTGCVQYGLHRILWWQKHSWEQEINNWNTDGSQKPWAAIVQPFECQLCLEQPRMSSNDAVNTVCGPAQTACASALQTAAQCNTQDKFDRNLAHQITQSPPKLVNHRNGKTTGSMRAATQNSGLGKRPKGWALQNVAQACRLKALLT